MSRPLSRKQLQVLLAAVATVVGAGARAQADDTPVDYLQINAAHAQTFMEGASQVVYVDQPLTIETDRVKLSAKGAVIWFTPVEGAALGRQRAEIALLGDATLVQGDVTRTGERLFVSTVVGGSVRLCVQQREAIDLRGSENYRIASEMRPVILNGTDVRDAVLVNEPTPDEPPSTQPTTGPTTLPFAKAPVFFNGGAIQTTRNTPDNKIAAVLRGNVLLTQRMANGDFVELQADQAVLFTTLDTFGDIQNQSEDVANSINSAYLEGDVRINYTPATRAGRQAGEQRLRATRAYYEFGTNRAILTDVVLQSSDPRLPFPITMRANVAKQLSMGEYKAQHVTLTTSQFASPSYSINASKAYVRQYKDADPNAGQRTQYEASNATFRTFGVPIFYFPFAAGDISQNAYPLRGVAIGSSRSTGFGIQTTWGLFESIGKQPPPGVDAQFHLDYFADRGFATGLDGKYKGGELAQSTAAAWNFSGNFSAYVIPKDGGADYLGRDRVNIGQEDEFRGRLKWEHQQILPGDWQTQFRVGLVSDPTFLPQWYPGEFDTGLPANLSAYAKHQTNTEALTFLVEYQPNDIVTTADGLQNRFVGDRGELLADSNGNTSPAGSLADRPFEVDRLPEVGYYRLGESFNNDTMTLMSENRIGGYRMNEGSATYGSTASAGETDRNNYGFRASPENVARGRKDRYALPGIPSIGYTGTTEDYVLRGDFRQEVDYPIDAGRFKVVPYVVGRYTGYSDSPQDDPENRLLGGVGARINTAFWKVDDEAHSEFFDVNRVRHVVEPELNLFTSVASVDRNDVYVYDESIDGINDVSAVSFFVRQRWQTKRGAPGLYRSIDFLTFNLGVIGFANTPSEVRNPDRVYARDFYAARGDEDHFGPTSAKNFRGLFFQSTPEASIPRSSIQGDVSWRVADTTILLGDASWNIEEQDLSTAAVGALVGRGDRVNYFAGLRYIGGIDSTIASFNTTYQISAKYTLNFGAAIDLARNAKGGNASIIRRFDRFFVGVGGYYDQTDNESGFTVSFYPEGLAGSVNSGQLSQFQR